MRIIYLLILLFPAFAFTQKSEAEKAMYRLPKYNKTLKNVLKEPEVADYVYIENYSDSVFPNTEILRLKNVAHIFVKGKSLRTKKDEPEKAPQKIRIDTTALKQLPQLKYIEFSYFDFSTFPVELFAMKNLKGLAVNSCMLKNIPAEILLLKNLVVLNLRVNEISSLPASISQMDSLRVLDLSNNAFTKIPEILTSLKRIEKINLANAVMMDPGLISQDWPYTGSVNKFNFYERVETLKTVLGLETLKTFYLQVDSREEKKRIIEKLNNTGLSDKIDFKVRPEN